MSKYIDERVAVNLIGSAVGVDTLIDAYFGNDQEAVVKALVQKSNDMDSVKKLLDMMNYNVRGRFLNGKSMLGEIQKGIIDGFMTKDNVESFETDLVGTPSMFADVKDNSGRPMDYSSIQGVYPYFNQRKEMLISLEQSKNR
ncbi:MAG: hypothetical protein ACM3O4_01445 [Ignavibacteriales bacterium]